MPEAAAPSGRSLQEALARKCHHPDDVFVAFPRSALDDGVPARFEQQVRRHGARLAVRSEDGDLSYAELNGAANKIAHALLALAAQCGPFVALLVDQGAMNVAAPLGVLKAGKAFVPLDTRWPVARMTWVLDHSKADVLLASAGNLPLAHLVAQARQRVVALEELLASADRPDPGVPIEPDAPALILYTSGSTGRPKGVLDSHRNLLHEAMRLTNALHVCSHDRQTLLRANSAGAISDTFTALLNGAALFPFDVLRSGVPGLASWLTREALTIWRSTPSLFRTLLGALPPGERLPHLRILFLCGEPVNRADLEGYRAHAGPACLLVNCLGSTECTTVTLSLSDRDAPAVPGLLPVGYPVEDMDVQLVGESGDVIAGPGPGEIVVRSRYLARGYVDDPRLTARSFREDSQDVARRLYFTGDVGARLDDGSLVCLGRRESRANVRGRTFELAELETALQGLDGIREAVAAVVADARGEQHVVAYVVPDAGAAPSSAVLRRGLRERVPSFMIPARFLAVDGLPLTATGKADRNALEAVSAQELAAGSGRAAHQRRGDPGRDLDAGAAGRSRGDRRRLLRPGR